MEYSVASASNAESVIMGYRSVGIATLKYIHLPIENLKPFKLSRLCFTLTIIPNSNSVLLTVILKYLLRPAFAYINLCNRKPQHTQASCVLFI